MMQIDVLALGFEFTPTLRARTERPLISAC